MRGHSPRAKTKGRRARPGRGGQSRKTTGEGKKSVKILNELKRDQLQRGGLQGCRKAAPTKTQSYKKFLNPEYAGSH